MILIYLLFVSFLATNTVSIDLQFFNINEIDGNTVNRIKADGYNVEEHEVQTSDGYLLTLHRIPSVKSNKPPIYLQHGMLTSSSDWILNGPGKALAYLLSDLGYDVWMGNNRGNTYSRKHAWIKPSKQSFWNFSWNEIGLYDVSATIDYILKKTSHKKIQYIGHSQGTTSFFVLAATRPEYNDKVLSMHALAPVAFMGKMKSPFVRVLAPITGIPNAIIELFGSLELLPNSKILSKFGELACRDNSPIQEICTNIVFLMGGYDSENFNRTLLPDMVATIPAGGSINQVLHYAQVYKSDKFRMFDYGIIRNLIKYGNKRPPKYSLEKITTPTALYYGNNDWLVEEADVKQLASSLGNFQINYRIPHDKWNHLDFLWAIDTKKLLYDKLFKDLEHFQKRNNYSVIIIKKLA